MSMMLTLRVIVVPGVIDGVTKLFGIISSVGSGEEKELGSMFIVAIEANTAVIRSEIKIFLVVLYMAFLLSLVIFSCVAEFLNVLEYFSIWWFYKKCGSLLGGAVLWLWVFSEVFGDCSDVFHVDEVVVVDVDDWVPVWIAWLASEGFGYSADVFHVDYAVAVEVVVFVCFV